MEPSERAGWKVGNERMAGRVGTIEDWKVWNESVGSEAWNEMMGWMAWYDTIRLEAWNEMMGWEDWNDQDGGLGGLGQYGRLGRLGR